MGGTAQHIGINRGNEMRGTARLGAGAPQGSGVALGALVVLVICSLALVALDVAASPLGRRTVVAGLIVLVLMPAVMLGQYAPPPYRLPHRWRWGLLLVQAVLTYLPLLLFHYRWLSLLGFLAGAVLLTLPPSSSVPIALAAGASGPLLATTGLITTDRSSLNILLGTAITASTVFAVAHLALLTARLGANREHAAHLAEQRERARMQQDLHDLVGSALTAIVLQGEVALRERGTPSAGPGGSAHERALTEIAGLARRLHDDVRSICRPDGAPSPCPRSSPMLSGCSPRPAWRCGPCCRRGPSPIRRSRAACASSCARPWATYSSTAGPPTARSSCGRKARRPD
ncbi:histidine kinase [Streptomyces sp. or20]|uniref:histidine kinase n=1 Tax=Streptomyces sp. or20 TaxID=1828016 RepID=UPI00211D9784|nr:histidine kinase [Streptomyces sp. or20]